MGLCESGIDDQSHRNTTPKLPSQDENESMEEFAMSDSQNNILSQIHFEIKEMRDEMNEYKRQLSELLSQKSPTSVRSGDSNVSSSNQYNHAHPHHGHGAHHRYLSSTSSLGTLNLGFDDNTNSSVNNLSINNDPLPVFEPFTASMPSHTKNIILQHRGHILDDIEQDPIKQ